MISEFPLIRAQRGRAGLQLSHTAPGEGVPAALQRSDVVLCREECASLLIQAGRGCQHGHGMSCTSWHLLGTANLTCRAHLGGLCQELPPLWAPLQGFGGLALCFHLPELCRSPVHPVMAQNRLCPLFSILAARRFKNINKSIPVLNIPKLFKIRLGWGNRIKRREIRLREQLTPEL